MRWMNIEMIMMAMTDFNLRLASLRWQRCVYVRVDSGEFVWWTMYYSKHFSNGLRDLYEMSMECGHVASRCIRRVGESSHETTKRQYRSTHPCSKAEVEQWLRQRLSLDYWDVFSSRWMCCARFTNKFKSKHKRQLYSMNQSNVFEYCSNRCTLLQSIDHEAWAQAPLNCFWSDFIWICYQRRTSIGGHDYTFSAKGQHLDGIILMKSVHDPFIN